MTKKAATERTKANNETEIRALIDQFAKAFRAKDVQGIMSFFAPEIVSFDILPPLAAIGAAVFVTHWEEFFGAHETLDVEFPEVKIVTADDVAFSYCLHRVKGTLKNGGKTDWWLRWTAGYRKTNGKWLIVHEQVSVPVELKSGKAPEKQIEWARHPRTMSRVKEMRHKHLSTVPPMGSSPALSKAATHSSAK